MNALPPTTKSRLRKIPQNSAVWEGDRRCLGTIAALVESDLGDNEECIMWVDGSEGAVRVMDMVSASVGHEAVVRALLKAIESPHHPAQPARPSKIIIRDRELQFFLRGALQDLDIKIEYAAELPLIDELFRGFEAMNLQQSPLLPEKYTALLEKVALDIWQDSAWEILADSDILTVEIADSNLERIYVCVMGMMSAEYGVLLYRSLDSLKQFRIAAIAESNSEALEQAFLAQDCWFLNYEIAAESAEWETPELEDIEPLFGSLHPLEGMRASLDEAEAEIVYFALEAIHRFSQAYRSQLAQEEIPPIQTEFTIDLPESLADGQTRVVTVTTAPELTADLLAMDRDNLPPELEEESGLTIHEDLIPNGSLVTMGQVSWSLLESLKQQSKTYYQAQTIVPDGRGLPSILVQTSRPKAMAMIETIKSAGGLRGICFNPGRDPFTDESYDLGLLQTEDQALYLFAEYFQNNTRQSSAVAKWQETCDETSGYCGLIITMGVTGASKGNPKPQHMLAVFEARAIAGEEIGLGVLQLMPEFD